MGSLGKEFISDMNLMEYLQDGVLSFFEKYSVIFGWILRALLLAAYVVYLAVAVWHDAEGALFLLVVTGSFVAWKGSRWVASKLRQPALTYCAAPLGSLKRAFWPHFKWLLYPGLLVALVLYCSLIIRDVRQMQSLMGLVFCLFVPYATCNRPSKVRWRPVIWGLALQFILGVLTLRWEPGYKAMKWASEQINTFLSYAFEGAALAFGDPTFLLHPLVMMVLPIVIYIGAVTGILYQLGAVQAVVRKFGYFMRLTLGTTGPESVNIILNIFLSVAETATIMKPYLTKLTDSEFYTLVVGSHASIAGFAYPLFILVGIDGRHLLTASLMSAPAAVAMSKLNFPETQESEFKSEDDCTLDHADTSTSDNVAMAMTNAALQAGKTCGSLLVQILAFFSIYAFLDVVVAYFGSRVGLDISLAIIFAKVFQPFAFMIGVDWAETDQVASLLGLKLTINEIIAYLDLGRMRRLGILSERASMLTTYAICGFSSVGTLAIFLGVWATVVPSRALEMSRLLPRVYVTTNLSCFLTACIAGILYNEEIGWSSDSGGSRLDISGAGLSLPSYKDILSLVGY